MSIAHHKNYLGYISKQLFCEYCETLTALGFESWRGAVNCQNSPSEGVSCTSSHSARPHERKIRRVACFWVTLTTQCSGTADCPSGLC